MKDIVLQGFVKSFAQGRGLINIEESKLFEIFATSAILRKFHQTDAPDPENLALGGGGDGGIDAVAVLVNGRIVRTTEDIDFFLDKLRRFDVEFVFVQAKTSSTFRSADMGHFIAGVESFFDPDSRIPLHEDIQDMRQLKEHIYDKSIHMERNPVCALYYVTTGTWNNDPDPVERVRWGREHLESTNLFSEVNVVPVDAKRLKTVYRELERGIKKEVEFSKIAVFPRIEGVREAYVGLLPGDQFIHLVTTDDGILNRELFFDNVRDYQGHNHVNKEIEQTLKSDDLRGRFPLLNNGVTIVARSITRTGDTFKISDFQIVNGCQTTHVLYQNRLAVDSNAYIPVKLVVTDDSEVINEVIKATNRQTAVLPEALESLSPFHRELEDFYNVRQADVDKNDRIYYERRSKQYAFDKILPARIVTLTGQIKSFVAMFLNEPHSHPRYYGELLRAYESRLFVPDHSVALYYASGCALSAVDRLFGSGVFDRSLARWKYHVLMLLRIQMGGKDVPRLNSSKASPYALSIMDKLSDESVLEEQVSVAIETISDQEKVFPKTDVHSSRLRVFTEKLIETAGISPVAVNDVDVTDSEERGQILWYDETRNFGFIRRETGGDVFVHRTGISDVPWHMRQSGVKVIYKRVTNVRRDGMVDWRADKVRLL